MQTPYNTLAVSRVSQFNCNPALGTVTALKVIAGYLKGSIDFRGGGTRLLDVELWMIISVFLLIVITMEII
jgi:hypothetical protein